MEKFLGKKLTGEAGIETIREFLGRYPVDQLCSLEKQIRTNLSSPDSRCMPEKNDVHNPVVDQSVAEKAISDGSKVAEVAVAEEISCSYFGVTKAAGDGPDVPQTLLGESNGRCQTTGGVCGVGGCTSAAACPDLMDGNSSVARRQTSAGLTFLDDAEPSSGVRRQMGMSPGVCQTPSPAVDGEPAASSFSRVSTL